MRASAAALVLGVLVLAPGAHASHSPFDTPLWRGLADVRMHGHTRTMQVQLENFDWCFPEGDCMSTVIDYGAPQRISYLPIRPRAPLVVRTRLRAASVVVSLFDRAGRRVARLDLKSLGAPGRVWRRRLPRGISSARDARLRIHYPAGDGPRSKGEAYYSIYVCPLRRGCPQPRG